MMVAVWSSAEIALEFDLDRYQVTPGDTLDVSVYLQQTAGGPQIGPGNELISAGLRVQFDLTPLPTEPAMVLSASDITGNPSFSNADASVETGQYADLALLTFSGVDVDASGRLFLGSFRFTTGTVLDEITVAEIPGGSNFLTVNGHLLTPIGDMATIQVVPEPSTLLMLLTTFPALALGAGIRRWSR